ncbi:NAD-dependent epimerase/dehydratase family protein [Bradyrhizobium canariense]|uniref:UDP-glucose 4-epimerase n=1 Tax=Bradyrhizobium canariense TaxID=255045 RepID=A0A1H1WUD5_9BRAD|nr:NAD-dependent epimerase/dehydratase family protein [Bradyrhizobium canariense]SDS99769.1 UDP-glucose 4-epimerase [Bradyrhizobium canariense]
MNFADKRRAFVTGGGGFIGSHIVDRLAQTAASVRIYDNFSTGQEQFIGHHAGNPEIRVVRADVLDSERLNKEMAGCDIVFHFQANADVRGGTTRTQIDLQQNTIATWNVLEAMRINEIKHIVFASSATVYGEPDIFPTPESYAPLQTSLYGASKLSCEAMIQAYCEYFGIACHIFRFVSWIGERYSHGVIFDFMKKLRKDERVLEILGDGKQRKSYLDVVDGVDGIFYALEHSKERKNVFNLGHDAFMNVLDLADIIVDELGLREVRYATTGGERGWLGDSPFVHLDTTKLKALGWRPRISIEQGVRNTVQYLKAHPQLLERSV